jgi:hypothetical protein
MVISIIQDVTVTEKNGQQKVCRAGDTASVFHALGRRLIYSNHARWIGAEDNDPFWEPAPFLRASVPRKDTMIRKALNKGAA